MDAYTPFEYGLAELSLSPHLIFYVALCYQQQIISYY